MSQHTENTVRELSLNDLSHASGGSASEPPPGAVGPEYARGRDVVGPEYAGRHIIGPEIAGVRGLVGPEI